MEASVIFICHASEDAGLASRLERELTSVGSTVRRSEEHSGLNQLWSKTAGESIASSSLFILLWSRHAALSPFVEFEYTKALALQKTVLPCLLDNTPAVPLPGSMQSQSYEDPDEGVRRTLAAIESLGLKKTRPRETVSTPVPAGLFAETPQASAEAGTVLLGQADSAAAEARTLLPGAGPQPGFQREPDSIRLGDRYKVVRLLGKGGMGAVYHAYDSELERDVALKVIRAELAEDPALLKRFKREIQLSSTVTHRNVLRVYDLGESEGIKFLTMQYVEGDDLGSLLRREGRLPLPRVLKIFRQICQGLAAAHEQGILHRDLKPANVMVGKDDEVYLTDFGLARSAAQSGITQAGDVMGTPHYMSPEQVKGEQADSRSDIYSLGTILYEMVTGQAPYTGNTIFEVMIQRVQKPPRPAIELNPEVPSYLENIIKRSMAIEKAARYSSVEELLTDLDRGMDTGRTMVATKFYMRRWRSLVAALRWRRVAMALPVILLLAAGGFWLWRQGPNTGPVPAHPPVSVLITDFENRTGDPLFDGTLEHALENSLEGASFVTIFDRNQARKIGGQLKESATALDSATARLVATREGINVIVEGAISTRGSGYEISATAVDALTGEQMVAAEAAVSKKEEALTAAARLAAKIRSTLGDTTPESAQLAAAETFSASSLEAAEAYAQASKLQGSGKWEEAAASYKKAIELDPQMGRAYASLAVMYRNLGRRDQAEEEFLQAMKYIDGMTDREKYRTRGAYFIVVGNYPKAIEELTQLTERYPADLSGHTNLALSYFYTRRMSSAFESARRALAIYPNNVVMRSNLALFAMYAGDFETAEKAASDYLKKEKPYWRTCVALALSQTVLGRPQEASDTYATLEETAAPGPSVAVTGLADLAMYQGRLDEAVELLRKGIATDREGKNGAAANRKSLILASALLGLGSKQQALAEADRVVAESEDAALRYEASRIYLAAGQEEKALKIASELGKSMREEHRTYAQLIEGEAQLSKGETWEAIRLLHDAQELLDTWLGRYFKGRAYLEGAAYTEAYSEFEQCLKRRGEAVSVFLDDIPSIRYLPELYYYMGRAQEGLGSRAAADSYKTYIGIRGQAKQDPLAADAKRRLASF